VTPDEYIREVGYWLNDLPWSMRRDLLAELRTHLDELPPGTDLRTELGPPQKYAGDLRSAAGLERRRGPIAFLRARRPRNLILIVLVLAVIELGIGAIVWIDRYQPLAFGDTYQFPAGAKSAPGLEGESVVFRKGRPFRLGVNVFNNGRFPVRVLGVPYWSWLPFSGRVMMSKPAKYTGGVYKPFTRFHPFDLKPGKAVFLYLQGVYACRSGTASGSSTGLNSFPVRYSFLWRTRTTYIPFGEDLAFVFKKGCPPAKNPTITP
jgi:hypothetical protein